MTGEEKLNRAESETCLQLLLDDKSGSWLDGLNEKSMEKFVSGLPRPCDELAIFCIERGHIELLKHKNFPRFTKEGDEKILAALEKSSGQKAVVASLYRLGGNCPKLVEAIETFVKTNPDEEVLLQLIENWKSSKKVIDHANQKLQERIIPLLEVAKAKNFDKLRDACMGIVLSNVGQFGGVWFDDKPDLIAAMLKVTKREADWDRDRLGKTSHILCADEGLALVKYAEAHSAESLGKECVAYVRRNRAYLTAVNAIPALDRTAYQPLLKIFV